jgi:hypothetical protein
MRTFLHQSSFEPGASVRLGATLAESGVPARSGAHVWAEIIRPDNTRSTVGLNESGDGEFSGSFTTTMSGLYRCRVRASGRTHLGHPFQREQTLTAVVWQGGDRDADPNNSGGGPLVGWLQERDEKLCRLLRCLLAERGVITPEFEKRLREAGLDVARLRQCLEAYCQPSKQSDESRTARSGTETRTGLTAGTNPDAPSSPTPGAPPRRCDE